MGVVVKGVAGVRRVRFYFFIGIRERIRQSEELSHAVRPQLGVSWWQT